MSTKIEGQFLPEPLDLLESDAWREAREHPLVMRFIDFLKLEHLRHGGKRTAGFLRPMLN